MPPSRATSTTLRLVGGKGGVGKTTCAAAMAVDDALHGRRTLVVSTDPAPSLGDALGTGLRATPGRVPIGRGTLHALEIDAHRALERWLRPRRSILETVALRGTWLDESDVRRLLALSLPGIDELAALLELLRLLRTAAYDVIVLDTAPTGHTLRMLAMPETLGAVAHVFDEMQDRHRALGEALRGRHEGDAADALISELQRDAAALAGLLRDRARTEVTIVALPEAMAVEETLDAVATLASARIPVARIVVNRATPAPPQPCAWCASRRRLEQAAVSSLAGRLNGAGAGDRGGVPVSIVTARDREPIGPRALRRVAAELRVPAAGSIRSRLPRPPRHSSGARTALIPRSAHLPDSCPEPARIAPARLLMFGGKGGVGKTTCAAATALDLAGADRARQVLLVSTDPAHSLGDVLGVPLTDRPARLPGGPRNLLCRELDASRTLASLRAGYAASIDAMFDGFAPGSAIDVAHDRRVMRDLIDLAPPGLDEVAAVLDLMDVPGGDGAAGDLRIVVMDTAPTGHALRLLEMPAMLQEWVRTLMAILLKYQPVIGLGTLGHALLNLSRGIGRLRELLASDDARFVVVTRAAALPRAETARLVRRLRRMKIAVPAVVVNAAGGGTCRRCRAAARVERVEIARLARALPSKVPLILAPATVPPPSGAALGVWAGTWRRNP